MKSEKAVKIRPTIAEEAKEDIYFATVEFLCLSRFAIKSRIRHINAEDNVYFKAICQGLDRKYPIDEAINTPKQ